MIQTHTSFLESVVFITLVDHIGCWKLPLSEKEAQHFDIFNMQLTERKRGILPGEREAERYNNCGIEKGRC